MTVEGGKEEFSQPCRKSGFQQDKTSRLHEVTVACLGRGTHLPHFFLQLKFSCCVCNLSIIFKSLY